MRLNVLFREQNETITGLQESNEQIGVGFGSVQTRTSTDYNKLYNRPRINSVLLEGSLSAEDLGLGRVYYDTTESWNTQTNLIGEKGVIYIYSDYTYIEDQSGNQIPIAGIRIGDGTSYLIDMPFVSDAMSSALIMHVADQSVHVTPAEKEFWNNKVSAYEDPNQTETLVLSKTHYEKNGTIVAG